MRLLARRGCVRIPIAPPTRAQPAATPSFMLGPPTTTGDEHGTTTALTDLRGLRAPRAGVDRSAGDDGHAAHGPAPQRTRRARAAVRRRARRRVGGDPRRAASRHAAG